MSKQLRFWLAGIFCFLLALSVPAQVLSITAPANGATNVSARPTILASSTSTGNVSPNVAENIYFEVSSDPAFNPSLPSTNYQRSGIYLKNFDGPATFNWRLGNLLAFNTRFYARAVSNKSGASPVISFTTEGNPTAITAPQNGATDVFLRPTIVLTSTSTGNVSPNVSETFFFELSADPSFSTAQPAPNYQRTSLYLKNFDGPVNFTFVPAQLLPNTRYYVRAFSNKFGYSPTITFVTRGIRPPQIVFPANGQTGVSQTPSIQAFTNSVENTSPNPADAIYIEVSRDPLFTTTQPAPNYQRTGLYVKNFDGPVTYTYDVPPSLALELGQTYYTRAVSNKNGSSQVVSFTVSALPVLDTTYLQFVDGQLATNAVRYANNYNIPLVARFLSGANFYDWELDADGDFVNTPAQFRATTTSANLLLRADAPGLVSGQMYYVRVRGRKTVGVGAPITGPWSGEKATDRFVFRFYNALHPARLVSLYPSAVSFEEDDGGIRLFAPNIANAANIMFQVDDDPNFGSPYSLPPINSIVAGRNSTFPGVNGTVFFDNTSENGFRVFDNVAGLVNGTYYVRARALNANQSGYWFTPQAFTVNIPTLPTARLSIANNATDVPTYLEFQVLDDPNYLERSYDLQVSADNFATTVLNMVDAPHRGNLPSGVIGLSNLRFSTTYQARVRVNVYNYPANPTPWTVITFRTQDAPRVIIKDVPPSPWASRGANVYATEQPGINQYEWQVEKTNAPVSAFTKTTTLFYTDFRSYVQQGGQYRVRVRGNATGQGLIGVWSPWVAFSVSGTATREAAAEGNPAAEAGLTVKAAPNPFEGSTRIYLNNAGAKYTLTVTDLTGKLVEERQIGAIAVTEVGATWRSGIYVVKLISESGDVQMIKVVKR
ncbi:MAG: hypothetical protein AVDCRST_MAG56-4889 [uncultured Cytophagales bacterium]|uniref:Secretion system C-terminal sorting domain-containing protein n=1 Tax=uncultured Cytophagales bacterium TaxID=158755 RepID=A0A6J4JML1_9SPHI|nr:MAG: hypothetical protein AVDCRST_MAG56-4889 [uncultured Cytophagales bacterium]